MNERYKQLAEQAGLKVESFMTNPPKPFQILGSTEQFEKFAELIVRECNYLIQQQVSLKYKDGWEQSGISDDWAGGHYAASILSRTVIKQHFGVEE